MRFLNYPVLAMAGSTVDWSALKGLDPSNPSVVTVECTVVTGFEREAEKEARQKLGLDSVEKTQGREGFISPVPHLNRRFSVAIWRNCCKIGKMCYSILVC